MVQNRLYKSPLVDTISNYAKSGAFTTVAMDITILSEAVPIILVEIHLFFFSNKISYHVSYTVTGSKQAVPKSR
jgi:hypothetical protein